jgi:hypothetical protein
LLRRVRRVGGAVGEHVSIALACAGLLTGLYHQVYDLLLLAPAAVALLLGRPAALWAARPRLRWALALACLALFANYATTNTALQRLGISDAWWLAVVSLNGVLLLAIWLAYGGVALRLAVAADREPGGRRVWTRRRMGVAP